MLILYGQATHRPWLSVASAGFRQASLKLMAMDTEYAMWLTILIAALSVISLHARWQLQHWFICNALFQLILNSLDGGWDSVFVGVKA
jgi:hypothetical protein